MNRQLSLPVSMMSLWWVRRSSKAVVIFGSPNTEGHSPSDPVYGPVSELRRTFGRFDPSHREFRQSLSPNGGHPVSLRLAPTRLAGHTIVYQCPLSTRRRGRGFGHLLLQDPPAGLLEQDAQPVLAIFKQGFQFHDRGPMLGVGGRRRAPLMVVVT